MTKQVALANATYERLRRHRHPGESFSQAIERLLDNSKDPMSFIRTKAGKRSMTPAQHLRMIEADRDADRINL